MRNVDLKECCATTIPRFLYNDGHTKNPVYATQEYIIGYFNHTPIRLQYLLGDSYARYCVKAGSGFYCRDEEEAVKVALERWRIILDPQQMRGLSERERIENK